MLQAFDGSPGLQVCPFLFNWSCDGRTGHLTFIVCYDLCVIFRIKDHTVFSLVWPLLSHYRCWMYLLSELWFAFLERDHHHVTHTSSRKSVQRPLIPFTEIIHRFWLLCCQHNWLWPQPEDRKVLVAQLCPTLCDTMDDSPPGSSVHEIFQARILELGSHSLLQEIFLTQRSNPGLLQCRKFFTCSDKHWSTVSFLTVFKLRIIMFF